MFRPMAAALGLIFACAAPHAAAQQSACPADADAKAHGLQTRIDALPPGSAPPMDIYVDAEMLQVACPDNREVQVQVAGTSWRLVDYASDTEAVQLAVLAYTAIADIERSWAASDAALTGQRSEAANTARLREADLVGTILSGFVVPTMFMHMLKGEYHTGFDAASPEACPYETADLLDLELRGQYGQLAKFLDSVPAAQATIPALPNAFRLERLRDTCTPYARRISMSLAAAWLGLAERAAANPSAPLPNGNPVPDGLAAKLARKVLEEIATWEDLPDRTGISQEERTASAASIQTMKARAIELAGTS